MQGNPPQDLLLSVDCTSEDPESRTNRSGQNERELKFSRCPVLSPRKVSDSTIFSPALNRRHGFMELSTAKNSPRQKGTRSLKETPPQERSSVQHGLSRDEAIDVAQLNALLQTSIGKLSTLENEKNDRYERWKQEVV